MRRKNKEVVELDISIYLYQEVWKKARDGEEEEEET